MVAAAVVALLATMGYAAYESRHPASPLSNRDLVRSQAISQPVPFGAATVTPPAPATNPHPMLPQSSVAPPPSANPKPSPGVSSRPQMKRQSHRSADDTIADDEVVVHRASTPAPPRAASSSGTKHYSDLQQ
jgi:hypothetical protein